MAKNSYHHGDLRTALLSAARRLVAEKGPEGFTMAQAAREAGVSSGAPYKHFADRRALLTALAAEGTVLLEDRVRGAVEGIADPREAFRQTGIVFAQFAVDEPACFRLMSMPEYVDVREDDPNVTGFWGPLAEVVTAVPPDEPLPFHPLFSQLAARALVYGLASFLVQGSLEPFGIGGDRAWQLADVLTRMMSAPAVGPPE